MSEIRIGIIGTGRIATRFMSECDEANNAKVVAIYSHHIESVRFFVEQNKYSDDLLQTEDLEELFSTVDAVYIATPHEYHFTYAKKALEAGKHVLCEKPIALKGEDALELFELARDRRLICMEAIKTAYCPGFAGVLRLIEEGAIGKPYDIEATFTKIGGASGREMWGDYAGSFLELGSYVLLPVAKIHGIDSKQSYVWSVDSVTGCDSYSKVTITYEDVSATVKTGLGVKSEGELIIAGDSGYIRVPSPWWLTSRIEVHHEDPNKVETYESEFAGSGLRYEIREFANKVDGMNKIKAGIAPVNVTDGEAWSELMSSASLTAQESIWMAFQMEVFMASRAEKTVANDDNYNEVAKNQGINLAEPRYWGHRGCSYRYPENTLLAFEAAANVPGITGIEFDVQYTKDKQLVVIHDETVDRTTNGSGYVRDFTLEELQVLEITPSGRDEVFEVPEEQLEDIRREAPSLANVQVGDKLHISSLKEMLDVIAPYCKKNNLLLNIELKNSVYRYEGMEQMVIEMVREYGIEDNVVYSSFNHKSVGLVRDIDPDAETGILDVDELNCIEGMKKYSAVGLHPCCAGMAINSETVKWIMENDIPVRMWTGIEPLYGQSCRMPDVDLRRYALLGVTDIITNAPERYL
ncbi:MAG: Gfo/Idh/MocA family oxidoreductase [Lachnospiraceae bacterium]|nr:Gfo/Idh/MocA family oxidoreductase [Lachnospiraceae bacterium]